MQKTSFLLAALILMTSSLYPVDQYFTKALAFSAANNTESLAAMLRDGFNINAVDDDGNSLLHHAALTGNGDSASFLLKRKAQVNARNKALQTPLMLSAQQNNNVAWVLIGNKANMYAVDANNQKVAEYATSNLKKVLEAPSINDALYIAINLNMGAQVVKALLNGGADPSYNARNVGFSSTTPVILLAVQRNNLPVVKALVQAGANIHAKDNNNRSAITFAQELPGLLTKEMKDYLKKFSESYAQVLLQNVKNRLPDPEKLTNILKQPHSKILNTMLLDTIQNLTPTTSPTMINMLLATGADPNYRNPENEDPVAYIAIARFNLPVLQALVKAGANLSATDRFGRSAYGWVSDHKAPDDIKNYVLSRPSKR